MTRRLKSLIIVIAALVLVISAPSTALGDGGEEPGDEPTHLALAAPGGAWLGETVRIEATLTTEEGGAVPGAVVEFFRPISWGVWGALEEAHGGGAEEEDEHAEAVDDEHDEAAAGGDALEEDGHGEEESGGAEIEIGSAVTNAAGLAVILYEMRSEGSLAKITARFEGSEGFGPSSSESSFTVTGVSQLYTPSAGIRVPLLGAWLLAGILASVWGSYFVVGFLVFGIAASSPVADLATAGPGSTAGRSSINRRDFFQRAAVPIGMMAFVASTGSGILTILARNPKTHNNMKSSGELRQYSYSRTPFASLGIEGGMKPMPAILEREVSFAGEVLPIFLERAGPHVVAPKNSPPPGGLRLDSYEHIMAKEGLVVPGDPEESELVGVLRSDVMYMPPIRTAPLSEQHVQLIVSWIAQGARET